MRAAAQPHTHQCRLLPEAGSCKQPPHGRQNWSASFGAELCTQADIKCEASKRKVILRPPHPDLLAMKPKLCTRTRMRDQSIQMKARKSLKKKKKRWLERAIRGEPGILFCLWFQDWSQTSLFSRAVLFKLPPKKKKKKENYHFLESTCEASNSARLANSTRCWGQIMLPLPQAHQF